jgi:HEAT repeats
MFGVTRSTTAVLLAALLAGPARAEPVTLTIKQRYEKARASVRVDAPAKAFLAGAGLKVASRAELAITIELAGEGNSSEYEVMTMGRKTGTVERWIYADVSGPITVTRSGQAVGSAEFSGGADGFSMSLRAGQYRTRSQAPYAAAFAESDFAYALADALAPALDSAHVVSGLVALAKNKAAGESMQLSALCRLTKEADPGAIDQLALQLSARKIGFDTADATHNEQDLRHLGLIATVRLARGQVGDDERAELVKRYRAGVDKGFCGRGTDDLRILGLLGEPMVTALMEATDVYDRTTQEAAILRLAALGAGRAVPVLMKLADKDTTWSVRFAAVNALGKLADPSARELLGRVAKDDDEKLVRDAATAALAKLPPS